MSETVLTQQQPETEKTETVEREDRAIDLV